MSYNNSGFICHVTFYFYSKYTTGDIRIIPVLKCKTLLPHTNFPRTTLVSSLYIYALFTTISNFEVGKEIKVGLI